MSAKIFETASVSSMDVAICLKVVRRRSVARCGCAETLIELGGSDPNLIAISSSLRDDRKRLMKNDRHSGKLSACGHVFVGHENSALFHSTRFRHAACIVLAVVSKRVLFHVSHTLQLLATVEAALAVHPGFVHAGAGLRVLPRGRS